mgnify:CR=1 FL=1
MKLFVFFPQSIWFILISLNYSEVKLNYEESRRDYCESLLKSVMDKKEEIN